MFKLRSIQSLKQFRRNIHSFLLATNKPKNELEVMLKQIKKDSVVKTYNLGKSMNIAVSSNNSYMLRDLDYYVYQKDAITCMLIGDVKNEKEVKQAYGLTSQSGAGLIYESYKLFGKRVFSFINGVFSFLIIDNQTGKLEIYSDKMGQMPVYYTNQLDSLWIFNEAKLLTSHPDLSLKLVPKTFFDLSKNQQNDFTIFEKIKKVPKGNTLLLDKSANLRFESKFYSLEPSYTFLNDNSQIQSVLNSLLENSIQQSMRNTQSPYFLLSGGLDSSLVCSIARKYSNNLNTISMGTESSNEFEWAKIVSDFIGSKHKEILLTNDQVIDGIANSVYENEIFDGLSAEIQSPIYNLLKSVKSSYNKVVTGYGADLLFGGVISLETPLENVNEILLNQIKRTQWTGEMSPFLGNRFNIDIEHPFWNTNLLEFAISLDPKYKKDSQDVKLIVREMASKLKYLPDCITYRKKIGIHQASSINDIFGNFLGINSLKDSSYHSKDIFTYNLFKELFENKKKLNEIDLTQIAAKNQQYTVNQPLIKHSIINNIAIIELNHANSNNPFNKELTHSFNEALLRAENNDQVNAIVVTGGIGRSFSVGGDFNEVKNFKGGKEVDEWIDRVIEMYSTVLKLNKPSICAVDKYAIGIGFQLAMCFDKRIGTERCRFTMPELKHGISCTIGTGMMEHMFGRSQTNSVIFNDFEIDSKYAFDIKLLNKVVDDNSLLEEAVKEAKKLALYPKNAFVNTKKLANQSFLKTLENVREASKKAHRASFKNQEQLGHFKNILKNKY